MTKKLVDVLKSFSLPPHRKEKGTPQNLRWLLKNIAVKNSENPKLEKAVELIKEELRL